MAERDAQHMPTSQEMIDFVLVQSFQGSMHSTVVGVVEKVLRESVSDKLRWYSWLLEDFPSAFTSCGQSVCRYSKTMDWVAVISAKNHKRQRRKRQSVTAKREKSQTPKVLTAILTLPNLT